MAKSNKAQHPKSGASKAAKVKQGAKVQATEAKVEAGMRRAKPDAEVVPASNGKMVRLTVTEFIRRYAPTGSGNFVSREMVWTHTVKHEDKYYKQGETFECPERIAKRFLKIGVCHLEGDPHVAEQTEPGNEMKLIPGSRVVRRAETAGMAPNEKGKWTPEQDEDME